MKKKFLCFSALLLWGIQAGKVSAVETSELDAVVQDFKNLLPPEYAEAVAMRKISADDGFADAFAKPLDRADCKFGLRFGKQIATTVMERLKPSCDRLLAPIGKEWIPPPQDQRSKAFATCFDQAFSSQAIQIVYDTAELCSWQGFESTLMAGQLEYNRCYLNVVEFVEFPAIVKDPYKPGALALVPADSERWTTMLQDIRSLYGAQSGYLSMLCELGKTDAESGRLPANILNRP